MEGQNSVCILEEDWMNSIEESAAKLILDWEAGIWLQVVSPL